MNPRLQPDDNPSPTEGASVDQREASSSKAPPTVEVSPVLPGVVPDPSAKECPSDEEGLAYTVSSTAAEDILDALDAMDDDRADDEVRSTRYPAQICGDTTITLRPAEGMPAMSSSSTRTRTTSSSSRRGTGRGATTPATRMRRLLSRGSRGPPGDAARASSRRSWPRASRSGTRWRRVTGDTAGHSARKRHPAVSVLVPR